MELAGRGICGYYEAVVAIKGKSQDWGDAKIVSIYRNWKLK